MDWTCEIVHSCGGRPYRVDTLVMSSSGRVVVLRNRPSAGAPKLYRDATERTPSDGEKVRWRCPRGLCAIDLTLTRDTLDRVGKKLMDAGVVSVELRSLVTTLS